MLFICKGLPSLTCAFHLQRTAVLVLCYSFAKDCGLVLCYSFAKDASLSCAIYLQRIAVLVLCYSFAKDCGGPCSLLFICKGLSSLIFAIRSQKTEAVAYQFQLQRIAVLDSAFLVYCYASAKDCVLVPP